MIVCTKKVVEQLGSKIENPARAGSIGKILAETPMTGLTPDEKRKICERVSEELGAMAKKYPFKIAIKVGTAGFSRRMSDFPENLESFHDSLSVSLYTEAGPNKGDFVHLYGFAGNKEYPISELPQLLDHVETQIRDKYWVNIIDEIMHLKGSYQCHSVHVGKQGTGSHGLPDAEIQIHPESRKIEVKVHADYRLLAKTFTFSLENISAAINFTAEQALAFQNRDRTSKGIFNDTETFRVAAGFAYAMTLE